MRRALVLRYLVIALAAGTAAAALRAQTQAPADAEYLRKAYDTYTSMRASSPYGQRRSVRPGGAFASSLR